MNKNGSTQGVYPKAVVENEKGKFYYKASNYDKFLQEIIGYESIFEVIAYRLGRELGLPCLRYDLVYGRVILPDSTKCVDTYLCCS